MSKDKKDYPSSSKEKQREYQQRYYNRHKERVLEKQRLYREANPDRVTETRRKSWAKHRDRRLKEQKEWVKTLRGCFCRKLSHLKKAKRSRLLEVDIDLDFLERMWNEQDGRCAITGYPMTYSKSCLFGVSIDRIDSSKGYTKNNIQLVCQAINFGKNQYTNQEMIEFWEFRNKEIPNE